LWPSVKAGSIFLSFTLDPGATVNRSRVFMAFSVSRDQLTGSRHRNGALHPGGVKTPLLIYLSWRG
jgi:hypothetical protein